MLRLVVLKIKNSQNYLLIKIITYFFVRELLCLLSWRNISQSLDVIRKR
jgi:hypothetical protein